MKSSVLILRCQSTHMSIFAVCAGISSTVTSMSPRSSAQVIFASDRSYKAAGTPAAADDVELTNTPQTTKIIHHFLPLSFTQCCNNDLNDGNANAKRTRNQLLPSQDVHWQALKQLSSVTYTRPFPASSTLLYIAHCLSPITLTAEESSHLVVVTRRTGCRRIVIFTQRTRTLDFVATFKKLNPRPSRLLCTVPL